MAYLKSTKGLKIGDVLNLRKNLRVGNMYGNFTFLSSLVQPKIEIAKIQDDTVVLAKNKNSSEPEHLWMYDVRMLEANKPIKPPIKKLTRKLNDIHK